MKKLSISLQAMYESCDRRTLYVTINNAENPVYDNVPCYSGRSLRDALQQAFQLADFFDVERPTTDHLVSDKLFSNLELEEALDDVNTMVDMLKRNNEYRAKKKKEREAKALSESQQ